ncbi:MAG TPA: N(4)-(beta-N-acetylglucosaminyl)-L-asparaginase [Devosiaceae bacterium]
MILLANSEGAPGISASAAALRAGKPALDALEAGIRLVEADPKVRSVGRGGWPNILGQVELDAAVMDGTTLRTGAVGALAGYLHPVSVARAVMERLPHELLVGAGAARFAQEIGADRDSNLIADSARTWRELIKHEAGPHAIDRLDNMALIDLCRAAMDPERVRDTTVYLGRDAAGGLASATSTSGWAWKYPGRLGDSPIIGAGSYADSAYGAAACTHTGEMTIRAGTARSIVLYLKMGLSLRDAVDEAVKDLARLRGGMLAGVVIHAIDARGTARVVAVNCDGDIRYWIWTPDMQAPELRAAEHQEI